MTSSKHFVKMDIEIQVAVEFITSFLDKTVNSAQLSCFCKELKSLLSKKFEGHWYPEKPAKGSAFRCLSIENHLDAVLVKAAESSPIALEVLSKNLPKKLDLWIDPSEVSYRVGEHGMVIVIYKEGDECVNSTSEYLAKVLNQLPTVTQTETKHTESGRSTPMKSHPGSFLPQHLVNNINMSINQRRNNNHLSASAKSFVSRKNGVGVNIPLNLRSLQQNINPLLNFEYLQKLQNWSLLAAANGNAYNPLAAQILQNLAVQELQLMTWQNLTKMQNLHRWSRKNHSHQHHHRQHNNQQANSSSGKGLQQVTV